MSCFTFKSNTLHYRGLGNGPLLIILPGNTASSASHQNDLEYFSKRHHVVALDYLGTGKSDRLDCWGTDWWQEGAKQTVGLMDHLGYESCCALGTSGGAIVALNMALHFPDRVSAVIADSCVDRFPPESLRDEVSCREQPPEELMEFWRHAHGEDWPDVVQADSSLLLSIADQGGGCFSESLQNVSCPVLLTASRCDSFLPDVVGRLKGMHRQIPNSELHLHDTGDHPFMWTHPDAFRSRADTFLAKLTL